MNDDLRAQANDWLMRLHGAPSSDELEAHELWLARSAGHRAAWREAQRRWAILGSLGENASAVERDIVRFVRKRRATRVAVAAVVLAVLSLGNWSYRPFAGVAIFADASTRPGQVREARLEDGTRIVMNGSTSLNWHFAPGRRDVTVGDGEAFFDVAHDAARPFYVTAGPARIRVTGTRFSVRRSGSVAVLELQQGRVQVSSSTNASRQSIDVTPGQSVTWQGGDAMRLSSFESDEVAAWRHGRLIVRSRPLSEVAADLQRWWPGRVIVLGKISNLRVTGVFRPSDVDRTLSDLEQSLPVRITRLGPLTVIQARP